MVIVNSLAVHELTTGAPEQYNLRVVEGLIATRLLLHAWGLDKSPRLEGKSGKDGRIWLREALDMWAGKLSEDELYEKALLEVDRVLGPGDKGKRGWTMEEMIEASGMDEKSFSQTFLEFIESEPSISRTTTSMLCSLYSSIVLNTRQFSPSNPLPPPTSPRPHAQRVPPRFRLFHTLSFFTSHHA